MTIALPNLEHIQALRELVDHLSCDISDSEVDVGLAELKALLRAFGVNQRGWRLLLDYRDTLLQPVRDCLFEHSAPLASLERFCLYLKMLQECEMDVIPPVDFVHAWLDMSLPGATNKVLTVPVGLFRSAWKECVRLQDDNTAKRTFLDKEMPAILRWFVDTDQDMILDDNAFKHGWSLLRDLHAEWKTRCTHVSDNHKDWKPLLIGKERAGNYVAIELANVESVFEEGTIMRHCIANYIPDCKEGNYHVVSLRHALTGERLATLGLIRRKGLWTVDELRMQDNEDSDRNLWEAALEVEDSCRKADFEHWQAADGIVVQHLAFMFHAILKDGKLAFADAAPELIAGIRMHMGLRWPLRLEDMQAAYIAVIGKHLDDATQEKLAALNFNTLEELVLIEPSGKAGACGRAVFFLLPWVRR